MVALAPSQWAQGDTDESRPILCLRTPLYVFSYWCICVLTPQCLCLPGYVHSGQFFQKKENIVLRYFVADLDIVV